MANVTYESLYFYWYTIDSSQVNPDLKKSFLQFYVDEETEEFVNQSANKSSWIFTQVWHCLVTAILNIFMTRTSING
ncbi:hypothetical protein Phum_PHUM191290 [Pediculus humanus corporis]|uniref:Uncharacterized protein n=1 Tax=Pediculus humanus subsp. corporis TaxID=121224 RepID=E0VGR4_PEDHC|nr:uncharacterized protein Phum_PHUM191290 [Pediculus humanus corporis]EEB12570.1 hypothetical protein Phum_PHUM191290 [Pediculus humanus corporis]